jgi:hypothetical protein
MLIAQQVYYSLIPKLDTKVSGMRPRAVECQSTQDEVDKFNGCLKFISVEFVRYKPSLIATQEGTRLV